MSKEDILKANSIYYRSHDKVTAQKFPTGEFYDPMDIIQVKYERLSEALESLHRNITELACSYGFSRASFYKFKIDTQIFNCNILHVFTSAFSKKYSLAALSGSIFLHEVLSM